MARSEGHPFEGARGLIVAGYDLAMGEFSGGLEGVNDLQRLAMMLAQVTLLSQTRA